LLDVGHWLLRCHSGGCAVERDMTASGMHGDGPPAAPSALPD